MPADIAVVIPCYDLGRTLEEAIDSVLAQSRQATEIIVVDDGSTDVLTRQVLSALDRPGTRVVSIDHSGVAVARNTGVALTTAPFILCLDADDVLAQACLERFGARLEADPTLGFVSCAVQAFEGASYVWKPPSTTVVGTLTRGSAHISSMFRKTLWDSVGGFDPGLPAYEDLDFWLTALEQGIRGEVLDDVLLYYRVRPGSRYRDAIEPGTYHRAMERIVERHRGVLDSHGVDVLAEKESFIDEIRRHHDSLLSSRRALLAELAALDQQIQDARQGGAVPGVGLPTPGAPAATSWHDSLFRQCVHEFLDARRWLVRGRVALISDAPWALERTTPSRWDENDGGTTIVLDRVAELAAASVDCAIVLVLSPSPDLDETLKLVARAIKPTGALLLAAPAFRGPEVVETINSADPTETWLRATLARVFPLDAFDVDVRGHLVATACVQMHASTRTPKLRFRARSGPDATADVGLVLAYHRVATLDPDTHGLCIPADAFRREMHFLRRHCTVMPLLDLFLAARDGALPPRAVAVTFDDGYLDALTTAAPILLEERIPATFFVNTERLTEPHEGWHDEVERILLGDGSLPPVLDVALGDRSLRLDTRTPSKRFDSLMRLHGELLMATAADRRAVVRFLTDQSGAAPPVRTERRLLLADEVRALSRLPGMEIGSHSAHHLFLPRHDPNVQLAELRDAKNALESLLDGSVTSFAYPFGEHDSGLEEQVRRTPHLLAVTVEPGLVTSATDPMRLPRLEVRGRESADFAALIGRSVGVGQPAHAVTWTPSSLAPPEDAIDRAWRENDALSRREYDAGLVTLSARPQFLIIDPSSRCNARCVMCPVSFRAPGDHGVDLTRAVFDKLATALPTASQVNLFSSGEPTIARDIEYLIGEVRRVTGRHTKVWLSTNGKRLPARIVEALMAPRFGLQFSVDGGSKEVFEAIRRGITFEELRGSLELARTMRGTRPYPEFSFSSTMSKRNIHDLANIFELARRYDVAHVVFYDEDPEVSEEEGFVLDSTDRPAFEQQRPRIEQSGVAYSNGLYFRGSDGLRAVEPAPPADPPPLRCLAPWKVFHQRADGSVRTCCTLRKSMGDLRHQTFEEVWNGEEYVKLRRAFVEQSGIPGTCYRCTDPLRTWGSPS